MSDGHILCGETFLRLFYMYGLCAVPFAYIYLSFNIQYWHVNDFGSADMPTLRVYTYGVMRSRASS